MYFLILMYFVTIQHSRNQRQKMLCFAPSLKGRAFSAFAPLGLGQTKAENAFLIDAE